MRKLQTKYLIIRANTPSSRKAALSSPYTGDEAEGGTNHSRGYFESEHNACKPANFALHLYVCRFVSYLGA